MRDGMGRLSPRATTHIEYTTRLGRIIVDRATGVVGGVENGFYTGMIGDVVEARKGYLYNKEHGTKIAEFTRTRKVVFTTGNPYD